MQHNRKRKQPSMILAVLLSLLVAFQNVLLVPASAVQTDSTDTGMTEQLAESASQQQPVDGVASEMEKTVLSWEWIGADELTDGVLALTDVNDENPVEFDTIVTKLPTAITAEIEDSEASEQISLEWSCEEFGKQSTDGEYIFTATLPESYVLAAEAQSLCVSVQLSGEETQEVQAATTYAAESKTSEWEEPAQIDGVYQIANASNLYWFAQQVNSGNTSISAILTANITLNEDVLTEEGKLNEANAAEFTQWTPIGGYSKKFIGTLDGANYTISGLYLPSNGQYQGLVGYLGDGGKIQNLTLSDSYISASNYAGAICAHSDKGTIENCTNNSTVAGQYTSIGGVCGYNNQGMIKDCVNNGIVSSNSNIGGVCGYNYKGTVENCINNGDITGRNSATGGVCGANGSQGKIQNCTNLGNITGASTTSGICGTNVGTIANCTNSGDIHATGTYVAGICGQSSNVNNVIKNCINTGTVTGTSNYVSGICGFNSGLTENCMNGGVVTGTSNYIGGVCGYNNYNGTVRNCINVNAVNGTSASVGSVCGYNSAYMSYYDNVVENCYYLEGTANSGIGSGEGEAIEKSEKQFASGEVTWMLNGQSSENPVWFQTLGEDAFPGFEGKIVYKVGTHYSNSETGEPTYLVEYCQLSMDGTIGLNFYVWLGEHADPSAFQMQFALPNGTTKTVSADIDQTQQVDGLTYYGFTAHVAAKEMTMDITAQLMQNGEAVGESCAYSVKDYADAVIDNESGSYTAEQITYAKNMLNYGGYVQEYFKYDTSELANAGVKNEISLADVTSDTLKGFSPSLNKGGVTGLSYYGTTLLFNSDTVVRHYFQLQSGKNINDYTFRYGDTILKPVMKSGKYYVDIPGLSAGKLNEMCVVTVTQNGITEPLQLTYGAYSYAYLSVLSNTAEKDVIRALYLYGQAAQAMTH